MTKNSKVIILLLVVAAITGLAGYNYYQQQANSKLFTGTVEVTRADITTKSSGYMKDLRIKEGASVTKGELLAAIDRDDLQIALTRDAASLKKAQAQLADLEKGARPAERNEAAANTAAALAAFDKAAKDYERSQALYRAGAAARQQLDNAQAAYDASAAQLKAAEEKANLLEAGNREDQILAAREEVNRSAAVLQAAQSALADTLVYSPLDGLILTKNFEPGEYVSAGAAIATVADMSDCWVKIYVPSTDLGKITIGDSAAVMIDSRPGEKFAGHIKEISDTAEYTPRQSITKNERANMVFAVKIAIDNGENILKPGMPADVMFYD